MSCLDGSGDSLATFRARLLDAFQQRGLVTDDALARYGVQRPCELRDVDLARLYHRQPRPTQQVLLEYMSRAYGCTVAQVAGFLLHTFQINAYPIRELTPLQKLQLRALVYEYLFCGFGPQEVERFAWRLISD